eukprot:61377-Alexandrium_andersonii.AAC.1
MSASLVGSEMCIRDRHYTLWHTDGNPRWAFLADARGQSAQGITENDREGSLKLAEGPCRELR